MPDSGTDFHTKLIAALVESDDMRRSERALRIEWLSALQIHDGIIAGSIDTLGMLHEARDCFVEGSYIAVLLLADSFIEHIITDELIERGLAKYGINDSIKVARENNIFSINMLIQAGHLREIRNPFVHRKSPTHQHSFGNRFIQSGAHPTALLEKDAKDALALMYEFFYATLKEE